MNRKLCVLLATIIILLTMVFPSGASETPKIYIDGELLYTDTPPVILNGRVMAPFRAVCEALGLSVNWDAEKEVAIAKKDGLGLVLQIGINYAYRNEEKIPLDAPPVMVNNRVMVPVRFIFENSGASVGWNDESKKVDISTAQAGFSKEYEEQVLALVNKEREAAGMMPLTAQTWLSELAEIRAKEQFEYYGHTRPDGTECFTVFEGVEYQKVGENVALGYPEPESVVRAWMESTGHRENILGDFQSLGVGVYIDSNGIVYWSQLFHK